MLRHMPRSKYAGLNVTPEAREAIRKLSFQLTGLANERVTMDAAIRAACAVAALDTKTAMEALEALKIIEAQND